MVKYSVIIPVYNSEKTITKCLDSLHHQTIDRDDYEIIVVDDGSKDGTAEKVKEYNDVNYYHQPNQGPAKARNEGVLKAKGAIVLFIDADCEALPDWLEEMARPFNDETVMGVKGAYLTGQQELTARFVQMEYESKYERMKKERYIDFIDTYSAAFRKRVFIDSKGYNTVFSNASVEDQEFSFRLAKQKHRLVFNPAARVYHLHVDNIKKYFRKKFKIGYWKVLVLKEHPEKMLRDSHTPQTLKIQLPLVYLIMALLIITAMVNHRIVWLLLGVTVAAYLLSVIYEMRMHIKKHPVMMIAAIVMIGIRSVALGAGLTAGTVKMLIAKEPEVMEV